MPMKQYIVYLRVWPKKTPSSVELTTQKDEVANFVSFHGGRIAGEYTDREGKQRGDRPELAKAIDHARRARSYVSHCPPREAGPQRPGHADVAGNVSSESAGDLDFVCLDNHDIHRKTIHVVANMAEMETRKISDRSKSALAAAKARGVKLGSHDPRVKKAELPREPTRRSRPPRRRSARRPANIYAFLMPADQGNARTGRDVAGDRRVAEPAGIHDDGRQAFHADRRVAAD